MKYSPWDSRELNGCICLYEDVTAFLWEYLNSQQTYAYSSLFLFYLNFILQSQVKTRESFGTGNATGMQL